MMEPRKQVVLMGGSYSLLVCGRSMDLLAVDLVCRLMVALRVRRRVNHFFGIICYESEMASK